MISVTIVIRPFLCLLYIAYCIFTLINLPKFILGDRMLTMVYRYNYFGVVLVDILSDDENNARELRCFEKAIFSCVILDFPLLMLNLIFSLPFVLTCAVVICGLALRKHLCLK